MDTESICPACGEFIDYCQGHGEIGDPNGYRTLMHHDMGEHDACHSNASEECHPFPELWSGGYNADYGGAFPVE